MRAVAKLLPVLLSFPLLAGCWDIRTIQDVNFFTAMGMDYKNGKWTMYVQQLDFSKVAKSDGAKSDTPPSIWIGKAEGSTLDEAVEQLYRTSQQTVFWGHLNAVVLTEGMLGSGRLGPVLDYLIRNREIRYTPWIYGTGGNMEDILRTLPFFNLTPLNSILQMPEADYKQLSEIRPIRLYAFVREWREPGGTVLLPSLRIDGKTWRKSGEKDDKLEMDGVYAVTAKGLSGKFPREKLAGLRWTLPGRGTIRLQLKRSGHPAGSLNVTESRSKLRLRAPGGKPAYTLELRVKAETMGMMETLGQSEIQSIAEEEIRREIREAFAYGKSRKTDLLKLNLALYRRHPTLWRQATRGGEAQGVVGELADVRVKVHLVDAKMYKLDRKMTGG